MNSIIKSSRKWEDKQESRVFLHLLHPVYKGRKITAYDVFRLKVANNAILDYQTYAKGEEEIHKISLKFDSMTDVVDFCQDMSHDLHFAQAQVDGKQGKVDIQKEGVQPFCCQNQLEREIQDEGFYIENGRLKLKRETSLEDQMMEKDEEIQDDSTLVHSDFLVNWSNEPLLLPFSEQSKNLLNNSGEKLQNQGEKIKIEVRGLQLKQLIKPLLQTFLLTGLMMGTTKILKGWILKR